MGAPLQVLHYLSLSLLQWIALVICTVWKQRRQKKYRGKNTQGLHRGGLCTRGGD